MMPAIINTIKDTVCIVSLDSNSIKYQQVATARIIDTGYEIPHPYFSRYISEYLLGKIKQQLTATNIMISTKISPKINPP